MQIPFTTRQEILDWAACYIENQREDRRELEEILIGFRGNIQSLEYLLPEVLHDDMTGNDIPEWVRQRALRYWIDRNPSGAIEMITREAFSLSDDWAKLSKLREIKGCGGNGVVASAILHLYDKGCYPFLSEYSLRAVKGNGKEINESLWRKYIRICREAVECYDVPIRTLDRALYARGNPDGDP